LKAETARPQDQTIRPPAPHGASPDGPVGQLPLVPADFDWKGAALETVREHPIPCLLGAALVGFLVGRYRGKAVAAAAVGLATNYLAKQIGASLAGEI
jgi:hypothetical protein